MEFRKIYMDMTTQEKTELQKYISINYKLGNHAKDRLFQKQITKEQVYDVLKFGHIIEFHYLDGSNRILVRGNNNELGNNVCVVIDIIKGRIVTVYKNNNANDNHKTLNRSQYIRNLDILSLAKYNKLRTIN